MQHGRTVRERDIDRLVGAARVDEHHLVAQAVQRRQAATEVVRFVLDDDRRSEERSTVGHFVGGMPAPLPWSPVFEPVSTEFEPPSTGIWQYWPLITPVLPPRST